MTREEILEEMRRVAAANGGVPVQGHRGEFKIGRTNLVDRRLVELGATTPVEYQLVHEIKTDDPAGVETYWHQRFAERRMRGEWFALSAADVRAFKRWRRLY